MSEATFIGCKISLISKAAIRYEGFLYSIDTKQCTVALSDVQSFGTESRPCEKHLPPRDEIYKYIVFRSSDISDIRVIDPPKPEEPKILSEDPAIVTVGSQNDPPPPASPYTPASRNQSVRNVEPSSGGPRVAHPAQSQTGREENRGYVAPQPATHQPSAFQEHRGRRNDEGGGEHRRNAAHRQDEYSQGRGRYDYSGGQWQNYGNRSAGYSGYRDNRSYYHEDYQQQYGNAGRQYENYRGPSRYQTEGYGNENRYSGGGGGWYHQGHQRGASRGAGGARGSGYAQQPQSRSFRGDYDFERANAMLEDTMAKMALTESTQNAENAANEAPGSSTDAANDQKCYDKKKSFFDTISSEALDRAQGVHSGSQLNRREERRVNAETFGVRGGGGGGGGPNRRYRGYNRGGAWQHEP